MPVYEYICDANGEVASVSHSMTVKITTWGELCEKLDLPLANTPEDSPVRRLLSGGVILTDKSIGSSSSGNSCCGTHGCSSGKH